MPHRLDPRFVTAQRISGVLRSLAEGALLLALAWALAEAGPGLLRRSATPYIIWALYVVLLTTWRLHRPVLVHRHASYRLDADCIEIRGGALWRKITSVPRSRVQHTDVSQGPLERHFQLGRLAIHTAGVASSVVWLEGITHARAIALRDALLPHARTDVV